MKGGKAWKRYWYYITRWTCGSAAALATSTVPLCGTVKHLPVFLGVRLHPLGNVRELLDDIRAFVGIGFHIEQRKPDRRLPILPGLAVVSGGNKGSVRVRQVQLPSAIATDDAFESRVR